MKPLIKYEKWIKYEIGIKLEIWKKQTISKSIKSGTFYILIFFWVSVYAIILIWYIVN